MIDEYFANPKANAESWDSDGFFKTGDIMYCDKETKKWYIVDRKKVCVRSTTYKCRFVLTRHNRNSSKSEVSK